MRALTALLLVVPLTSSSGWQLLRFSRVPPHDVRFTPEGLVIDVKRSAGPLVYPLAAPIVLRALRARGTLTGTLKVAGHQQGRPGFDDYALRVGLIDVGDRRPGLMERWFAPAWMRKLFDLAPQGLGISGVRFFNLGVSHEQIGRQRQHPSSELLHEQVAGVPGPDGEFELMVTFDSTAATAAVWIAVDGDDTHSNFTLRLERLELEAASGAMAVRDSRSVRMTH